MKPTGTSTSTATAALAAIVALASLIDELNEEQPAPLGARSVHLSQTPQRAGTYHVSSQSPSIDPRVILICTCGNRCAGSYTPRETTCSLASEGRTDPSPQTSLADDEGGT